VTVASPQAVYVWAGRLGDGTAVVRDSAGLLHALVPLAAIPPSGPPPAGG